MTRRPVHLSEGDVRLDRALPPKVIQVQIKESKTDLFRKGVKIHLGRTGNELCPVSAIVRGRGKGPFFNLVPGIRGATIQGGIGMRAALEASGQQSMQGTVSASGQ